MVTNACHRILASPADAQDAAQEAFVRAYQSLATFRGDGPFGAWVRRIAVRVAIARLAAGDGAVSLDDARRHDAAGLDRRTGADPVDRILDDEERATLLGPGPHTPLGQRRVVIAQVVADSPVD